MMLHQSAATAQRPPDSGAPALLVAEGIAKSFGGVQALGGATVALHAGEVHGLVGANGAGKSTFIKVLAGLVAPDSGRILLNGQLVSIGSSQRASALGLSFIHQELTFVPGMTVLQNIMLGLPKRSRLGGIDWIGTARDVAPVVERVGLRVPLGAQAKSLSTADNWLVSICRALVRDSRLIVMDEPTASLSAAEVERLMGIVEELARGGVAVAYVSHRLDEVLQLCHRVTAFRDGCTVAEIPRAELDRARLVEAIVGTAPEVCAVAPRGQVSGQACGTAQVGSALKVEGLSRLPRVKGVSFELHRGEVLGIGGLVGSGRTELARLIFGADRRDAGSMTLDGERYDPRSAVEAVRRGVGLVPEERRAQGLVPRQGVTFNLHLARTWGALVAGLPILSEAKRRAQALEVVRGLSIKVPDLDAPVLRLSGGNQQKVVMGRWLLRRPRVLILDEPTRGVDVRARAEIHRLVRGLVAEGMAAIVISSEPDELPDLCDRVLVMAEGRIARELRGPEITRNAIIEASYG